MNNYVEVLFELPLDIIEGLRNGTFRRIGGVIRNASNGQILLHLREVGDFINNSELQPSPNINNQYQLLFGNNFTTIGLSMLTLSVTTAGFIYFDKKLKYIEKNIYDMKNQLTELTDKVENINNHQIITCLSRLSSANTTLERAKLSHDPLNRDHDLLEARGLFTESKEMFRYLIKDMICNDKIVKYYDQYYQFTISMVLSSVGETKCNLYLNEANIALNNVSDFLMEFKYIKSNFFEQIDPTQKDFILIPFSKIPEIKAMKNDLEESFSRMDSFVDEIRYIQEINIPYIERENLKIEPNSNNPIIYLRPI